MGKRGADCQGHACKPLQNGRRKRGRLQGQTEYAVARRGAIGERRCRCRRSTNTSPIKPNQTVSVSLHRQGWRRPQ